MRYMKILVLTAVLMIVSVSGAFAFGIGLQLDGGPSGSGNSFGPSVTFKLDKYPVVFAANLDVTDEYFSLGLTGDWWMFNKQIDSSLPVKWFFGYGFFGRIGLGDPFALVAGGRLPVGINAFFNDGFIEPYLQIAPSLGIQFSPKFHLPEWYLPVSLGVRFWFD